MRSSLAILANRFGPLVVVLLASFIASFAVTIAASTASLNSQAAQFRQARPKL